MILGIDHVGIAVGDATAAVDLLADLVDRPGTEIEEVGGQAVRVAFVPANWPTVGARLEVLSPTDPSGAVARFLERRGEGLHHVCFLVDNLEAEVARLAPRFALVDAAPRRGHGGRVVFLHPKAVHGVMVELLERDEPPVEDPRHPHARPPAESSHGRREGEGEADLARARDLIERARGGDRRALARALSAVEAGGAPGCAVVAAAAGIRAATASVVGITGAPGSGKSTLVGALARAWRAADPDGPVAILAVDPSSPVSGGALLGDRIRMESIAGDPGTYVRSVAGRGAGDGLADAVGDMLSVLRVAGFGTILLETVGTGQDAFAVESLVDVTVVVHAPGLGDAIQGLKAGLVDLADVIVVNKADLDGAAALASALKFGRGDDPACLVLETVATTGAGVSDVRGKIMEALGRPHDLGARARRAIARAAVAMTRARVAEALRLDDPTGGVVERVVAGRLSPADAACAILYASGARGVSGQDAPAGPGARDGGGRGR